MQREKEKIMSDFTVIANLTRDDVLGLVNEDDEHKAYIVANALIDEDDDFIEYLIDG